MKTRRKEAVQSLLITALLLALPLSTRAWEPGAAQRNAAIQSGSLDAYVANLGKWIDQKVLADTRQITKKSIGALLSDPEFMGAVI